MATYALGDIQGCREALGRLLEEIAFHPAEDRLWLTGDLVNRGPDSLAVLRWARALGDRAVVVLGNHDLHLLAVASGLAPPKRRDTLRGMLEAPDRDELLDWLRRRPLMHCEGGFAMVHAGLLPDWTVDEALHLAREVERELRDRPRRLFASMYGDEPSRWSGSLRASDRHRAVINAMTRMRMLSPAGDMDLAYTAAPSGAPEGLVSWFDFPGRRSRGTPIVCGHWAALGLVLRPDLIALDTGCVWGRALSAVRLEDRAVFQVDCSGERGAPRAGGAAAD
jgi:bis(5'-nucleosyl)-tetraphosphatase (symmetrical)